MSLRIEGLKKLDWVVGGTACSVSKFFVKPKVNSSASIPKILLIRPGGIGDAALLYPALLALREEFPEAQINVLAEKRNAGILIGCPYIDRVFLYDRRPPVELFEALGSGYDIVIDTEQWHRLTAAFTYLTRASQRVGYATNRRGELFTHPVPYSHDDYEVYSFLNLVSAITKKRYEFNEDTPFIPLEDGLKERAHSILSQFRDKWKGVVGMFTGATVEERRWGVKKFSALFEALSGEGYGTVLLGGRSDIKDAGVLELNLNSKGKDGCLNLVGKLPLMETAAVISQVDLFITGDSGLMHVAYGVGTPTVSLFGSGIEKKWAPRGKRHVAINKHLFCSPCTKFGYTPRCPFGIACMRQITVDEVRESALKILRCQR